MNETFGFPAKEEDESDRSRDQITNNFLNRKINQNKTLKETSGF